MFLKSRRSHSLLFLRAISQNARSDDACVSEAIQSLSQANGRNRAKNNRAKNNKAKSNRPPNAPGSSRTQDKNNQQNYHNCTWRFF